MQDRDVERVTGVAQSCLGMINSGYVTGSFAARGITVRMILQWGHLPTVRKMAHPESPFRKEDATTWKTRAPAEDVVTKTRNPAPFLQGRKRSGAFNSHRIESIPKPIVLRSRLSRGEQ